MAFFLVLLHTILAQTSPITSPGVYKGDENQPFINWVWEFTSEEVTFCVSPRYRSTENCRYNDVCPLPPSGIEETYGTETGTWRRFFEDREKVMVTVSEEQSSTGVSGSISFSQGSESNWDMYNSSGRWAVLNGDGFTVDYRLVPGESPGDILMNQCQLENIPVGAWIAISLAIASGLYLIAMLVARFLQKAHPIWDVCCWNGVKITGRQARVAGSLRLYIFLPITIGGAIGTSILCLFTGTYMAFLFAFVSIAFIISGTSSMSLDLDARTMIIRHGIMVNFLNIIRTKLLDINTCKASVTCVTSRNAKGESSTTWYMDIGEHRLGCGNMCCEGLLQQRAELINEWLNLHRPPQPEGEAVTISEPRPVFQKKIRMKRGKRAEQKTCRACGSDIIHPSKFCNNCGTAVEVEVKCPSCGTVVPEQAKFCQSCGGATSGVAQPPPYSGDRQAPPDYGEPSIGKETLPVYSYGM